MDNKYFDLLQNNLEYNVKKMEEFFNIINNLDSKNYEERVEFMKNTWSKETLAQIPVTVYYGDLCYVKIYLENGKYKFEAQCKDISLEEIEKHCPEIMAPHKEVFTELYNKLSEFHKKANKNNNSNNLDLYYNNININKKNT